MPVKWIHPESHRPHKKRAEFADPSITLAARARQGKVMLDGGFGEIARRQFLNRLLMRHGRSLRRVHPDDVAAGMRLDPPPFFSPEALRVMRTGLREDIEALWEIMPHPQEIGPENFADLLSVRTRLPNTYGHEQARLDGLIVNYMPFAQPSFLDAVLGTAVRERRNSRAFKRILRENVPELRRIPFAKAGTTYAGWMPHTVAVGWALARRRFGQSFRDPIPHRVMLTLESFVRDLASSSEVRSLPYYDRAYLDSLVADFYSGNRTRVYALDRWLSFELWRQACGVRS